jgi:hypothetical protein
MRTPPSLIKGIKAIDPETRVTFIVRNQPSGAIHVQRGKVQLPRAELAGIKGDLQAFLALPQRLIGLPTRASSSRVLNGLPTVIV